MIVTKRDLLFAGIAIVIMMALTLCFPVTVFAVSTITTTSAGDGVFLLQGIGFEDAAALEITVQYDTATLANPRVVEGPFIAGFMTAINPNIPGTVRIVAVRLTPVRGSGVIATMTFDLKGSNPGQIISLTAKLANIKGATIPVLAQINKAPEVPKTEPDPQQVQQSPARTALTSQTSAPAIIIAGPSERPVETKVAPDVQGARAVDDGLVPPEAGGVPREEPKLMVRRTERASDANNTAASAKTSNRKIHKQKSILERFQEYKGKRTPDAFIALFEQDSMFWYNQDPPVALSDGKTTVRVTFISTPGNKSFSDVVVMGARLISLKPDLDNTNTWTVELVPEKGEYRASIAVSQGDGTMVYPLTIAPKVIIDLSRSEAITKAQFDRYFSERGSAEKTEFDANKDGKHDYIDDYIITANYLANAGEVQKKVQN